MEKLLFTILFLVYEVNTQVSGQNVYPGPLPYERFNVPCDVPIGQQPFQTPVPCQSCQTGPSINLSPASFNIGPIVPPCQQQVPSYQQTLPQVPINIPIQPPCGPIAPPCGPIAPPCGPIQPPFVPKPCNPSNLPTVGTIVDNTLANALANAIQLLIVSNLIENTANYATNIPINTFNYETPNCLTNIYDLTSPDYYYDLEIPYVQEQPCIQIPCAEFPSIPIAVQIPLTDCSCGNFGNGNGNFGGCNSNYPNIITENGIFGNIANGNCNCGSGNCGNFGNGNGNVGGCNSNYPNLITENGIFTNNANGNCNCGTGNCGNFNGNLGELICNCINGNGNFGGCNSNCPNLITENGIFTNTANGNCNSKSSNCGNIANLIPDIGILTNILNGNGNFVTGNTNFGIPVSCDGAIGKLAPVAAEVPIPASIPAQLVCNFGYMPTTVPCVSVNVEPLPLNNGCFC